MSRLLVRYGVPAALAVTLFASAPARAAASAPPGGAVGHDVSYPQCTSGGGTTVTGQGGQFGVVGVTDGLPWSANPCLTAEYSWASGLAYAPGLYANTANPAPHSSFYWPTSGASDPALCQNSASTTDPGCAYDYGWHAAKNALSTAAASVSGASSLAWWLDVEIANSWNGNGTSNAADLQGAVDYLRSQGVPSVGVYSSPSDWQTITGGYNGGTASSYASAWAPEFTAQYPLTGSPVWVAGAGSSTTASNTCQSTSFTGSQPQLAQFADGTGFDADLVCSPVPQSFALSLSPASGTVAIGSSTNVTASVTDSGSLQQVSLSASGQPSGVSVSFSKSTVYGSGSSTMTVSVTSAASTGSYPITVSGTGTSASQQATYTLTVSQAPPQSLALSVSPTSGTVKAGGSKQATLTVTEQGATQSVVLSGTVSPGGPRLSITPSSLSGPGTATMTLSTSRSTVPGTYTVTITATGSSGEKSTATYTLVVNGRSAGAHQPKSG